MKDDWIILDFSPILKKKIKKRIPLARDQMPPKLKTLGVVFNNGGIETNTFSGATTKTKG